MKHLLFVVMALALVAASCGSVEQEPSLATAIERSAAVGSTRIEVDAIDRETGEMAAIACEGAADYIRVRVRISCDYVGEGKLELIGIEDAVYYRGAPVSGSQSKWVRFDSDVQDTSLREFSPERLLAMLRAASSETERIGEEDVRGVSTVRYRLTVDCDGAERDCQGTSAVEVWIDEDGLVRRVELDDDSFEGTIEFFDFGAKVDIEPPQAGQVADFSQGWTGYGPSQRGDAAPCSEGEATPISEAKARETLRRHGFLITVDRSGYCIDGVAAVLANAPEDFDEQGSVSCFVSDKPAPGAPAMVVRRGADGADAELVLQNLECTIFTDSPTGEEKIDKLEAAFDELQRAIRP